MAARDGVRIVPCRFGVVLGKHGGALPKMLPAFRRFLGGAIGSGKQWFSWIHEEDLFRIFEFALENPHITGPVNCTSPNPVRNADFGNVLAAALGRAVILPPVPAFLIRMALGEFANVLVKGQRVTPKKLLENGFEFRFPALRQALDDLLESTTRPEVGR